MEKLEPPTPSTTSTTKKAEYSHVIDIPEDPSLGKPIDRRHYFRDVIYPIGCCSLALIAVLAFVGWVIDGKVHEQKYYMNPKYQIQLNCSSSLTGGAFNITSLMITKCDIDLYVKNPNKKVDVSYHNLRISLSGEGDNGDMFAAGTRPLTFSQMPMQTTLLHETILYVGGSSRDRVYKIKLETHWKKGTKANPHKTTWIRDLVCVNKIRVTPSSSSSSWNVDDKESAATSTTSLIQPIDCGDRYSTSADRYATFP